MLKGKRGNTSIFLAGNKKKSQQRNKNYEKNKIEII